MSIDPSVPPRTLRERLSSSFPCLWSSPEGTGLSQTQLGVLLLALTFLLRFQYWLGSAVFGTDCGYYLLMAD